MYDHRSTIEHDPGIGAIALHAVRRNAELFQLKLQLVRQSMHMRAAGAVRQNEIITERGNVRNADHIDLIGFFRIQNARCGFCKRQ